MLLDYSIQYSILCERIDELYKVVEFKRESELSEEFQEDFQKYLFLLAVLDGDISIEEVNTINFILGTIWTGMEIKRYVETNNIYSEEFITSVPKSFKKILQLERKIGNTQLIDFIIQFYYDMIWVLAEVERQEDFVEGYKALLTEYKRDSRAEK